MCAPVRRGLVGRASHAHSHARADVVAQRHRAQEVHTADPKLLAGGQGCGNNRNTWVRAGGAVRIVGLVGMSQHAVRQCGLDWTAHDIRCHDGRDLFASISTHKLDRCASRRQLGTRNHRSQSIKDVVFGLLYHIAGQSAAPGFGHVSAELVHDGTDRLLRYGWARFLSCNNRYAWKRCRGDRAPRTLQQPSPGYLLFHIRGSPLACIAVLRPTPASTHRPRVEFWNSCGFPRVRPRRRPCAPNTQLCRRIRSSLLEKTPRC